MDLHYDNSETLAIMDEWSDVNHVQLPKEDADIILRLADYLQWHIDNRKEYIRQMFWSGNEEESDRASDPDKWLFSQIVGVLDMAYRLGQGKPIDTNGLEAFDDVVASLLDG